MDLYKWELSFFADEKKKEHLLAKIVKIPPPGQHGGKWQVHWMTGDPDGSTLNRGTLIKGTSIQVLLSI